MLPTPGIAAVIRSIKNPYRDSCGEHLGYDFALDDAAEVAEIHTAVLRQEVERLRELKEGYKECFEQFIPESKWDEATAFLSSYGNGLAKDIQKREAIK